VVASSLQQLTEIFEHSFLYVEVYRSKSDKIISDSAAVTVIWSQDYTGP